MSRGAGLQRREVSLSDCGYKHTRGRQHTRRHEESLALLTCNEDWLSADEGKDRAAVLQ